MNTMTATTEFNIPSHNLNHLNAQLNKLNKRAVKLDIPQIGVEYGATSLVKVGSTMFEYTLVTIVGEVPVISGWNIIARVDHVDGVNIVKYSPGANVIPDEYKVTKPACDHCHTRRVKKYSVVIMNAETGEYKQVGKGCLADFIDLSVTRVFSFLTCFSEIIDELSDEESEWFGGGSVQDYRYPILDVLTVAAYYVRTDCFRPSDDNFSTKDSVINVLCYGNLEKLDTTDEDTATAKGIISWIVDSTETTSTFMETLKSLVEVEYVAVRYFGYLAGSIVGYIKHLEKKVVEDSKPVTLDEYAGEVGERKPFNVSLVREGSCEGYYGTTYIYTFHSTAGHVITWFASSKQELELNVPITIVGRIKKLDEFKGTKQTVLTRVKVTK